MSNSKISALPSATTPVAGTEVLPIVQSSATKQVSIANLTVGRAVTVGSLLATSASDNNVTVQSTGTSNAASVIIKSGNGTTSGLYSYVRMINDNTAGQDWRFGLYGDSDIQLVNATGSKNLMRWGTGGDVTFNTGNLLQGTAAKGVNFTANTPAAGMTSQLLNWYEEGTWTPTSFDISYSSASGSYTRIGSQVFVYFNIVLPATADANNITIAGFPFTVANLDQMRAGSIGYTDYGTACTPTAVKNTTRGNILTFAGAPVTNVSASTKTFSGVFIYRV